MKNSKLKHLYKVTLSRRDYLPLYVVASDEATAARSAEAMLVNWEYRPAGAVAVELVAWGDQYPPKGSGVRSDIPWLIA